MIRDNGAGINEADQKKIFEPFFTTKTSGTGLGLAVSRQIVESHGGTIQAVEPSEGGTLMKITLPALIPLL